MRDDDVQHEDGLICAVVFDGAGGGRELCWDDLTPIEESADSAGIQSVHLDFTHDRAKSWLRNSSGIDKVIVGALLDEDSRPRSINNADGMLVTLRGVNTNPGADAEDMVSIRIWLEAGRIVSTRRRHLLSVQSLREALANKEGPSTAGQFLVMLVHQLDERIEPVVEQFDEEVEAAELKFSGAARSPYAGEFSSLRRQSARIRRYLAPQRDTLERLSRENSELLTAEHRMLLREEADQMTRYLEDIDLVRERSMVAQEEILGQLAHEQNKRMYVLSIVAAIFLPLSFLTGLMGMNVAGLPGTENPSAFVLLALAMIGLAVGIVALFKWQKWL